MSKGNDDINNHQKNTNIPEELMKDNDSQVSDKDWEEALRLQKIFRRICMRRTSAYLRRKRENNSYVRQQQIENYNAMITREDRRKRYKLRQSKEMSSSDNSKDSDGYQSSTPEPLTVSVNIKDKKYKRVKFNI